MLLGCATRLPWRRLLVGAKWAAEGARIGQVAGWTQARGCVTMVRMGFGWSGTAACSSPEVGRKPLTLRAPFASTPDMRKRLLAASLVLCGVASGQQCIPGISGSVLQAPPVPPIGIGCSGSVTWDPPTSQSDCQPCTFNWQAVVNISTGGLPLIPGNLLVCASVGGSLSCGSPPPGSLVQTGSNPFTYQFTSTTTNFMTKCPSYMKLTLEWNAGLGFVTALAIALSCAGC